ncbi:Helix-turn-helix-domain containing protein, AraC type [Sphingopyxis sp. LC81]|uniref:AraC family transcriptional regulator n=1 Tax=Sphingopyxis sp. LC81 TaxID=1502850 RepID=UPI00050F5F28|nr:AraC family transcriptional regulator [Sphingopyxis sp. LC81]KGB56686.1 Helix-turn-helix-domain containing protein, AraC type [Sphingopyxis sp. LC81]
MAELVRVAALTGYFPAMRGLGADPRPLLRECGLSPELFANPEQLISARATMRLLERSAEVTGCETLGLRMAGERALANLGVASLLIAHQPTLRLALQAITEFRNQINSTLVLHVEPFGEEVVLREDFALSSPEPHRQSSDLALGVLVRLCASVLGDNWSPLSVCFSRGKPRASEMQVYRRLFHCDVTFDCEFNGLVIAAADLDRPAARADSALAGHARELISSVMNPAMRTAAQEVEQLIMLLLPSGRATVQYCAESMGTTVRTLQRMLDADGTSFSDLLNRARMQLSAQYLANPRTRITDVAEMLGYGSIGAYTRWHGQIFGVSPRQWRLSAIQRQPISSAPGN